MTSSRSARSERWRGTATCLCGEDAASTFMAAPAEAQRKLSKLCADLLGTT